jgi:hypothetical protein
MPLTWDDAGILEGFPNAFSEEKKKVKLLDTPHGKRFFYLTIFRTFSDTTEIEFRRHVP